MISYALYQVRTKEEAVEWASRFLRLHRDLWEGWEGEAEVLRVCSAPRTSRRPPERLNARRPRAGVAHRAGAHVSRLCHPFAEFSRTEVC
jgi:hypothetical protein